MVRLKDIALRAGVSVMTVSKVLRDAPDISSATKTRIRHLAAQMGYVPDSSAQSLRTRRTRLLGLVVSALSNPIYSTIAAALEQETFQLGYDLLIAHTLNLADREETAVRRLLARRMDGLFISPVYRLDPTAPIYRELKRQNLPTVLIGHRAPFCADFTSVETDDVTGAFEAVKNLLQLGHKRIAFLAGPQAAPWAQERLEGYRRALRDADLEPQDSYILQAGSTAAEGETAVRQMLEEKIRPTALFAVNDLVAMGAANYLLELGYEIPRQISVSGYGNMAASEFFRVPLTTVRQAQVRTGQIAVQLMIKLLKQERVDSVRLPAELIQRKSTAPPPR